MILNFSKYINKQQYFICDGLYIGGLTSRGHDYFAWSFSLLELISYDGPCSYIHGDLLNKSQERTL